MEQKRRLAIEGLMRIASVDVESLRLESGDAVWAKEVAERHLEMVHWLQTWIDEEDEKEGLR